MRAPVTPSPGADGAPGGPRPPGLKVVTVGVVIEAVLLVGAALMVGVEMLRGASNSVAVSVFLVLFFLGLAWLLLVSVRSLRAGRRSGRAPVEVLEDAIKELTPVLEVRSRRVGGATYQVPVEVPPTRARTLAVRWLVGFAAVRAEAGETVTVSIPIPSRRLAYWDDAWVVEPGVYTLRAGASVADLPLTVDWTVDA